MEGNGLKRYASVAKDLMEAIGSGRYPMGSLLPTEFELCDIYQASRHTVRAAISQLETQGMVSRRKRVGTRVEASMPASGYSQAIASVADLVNVAETHARDIQEVRHFVADIALARRLGLEAGGHYFCVSSIKIDRHDPAAPLCWTDVYAAQAFDQVITQAQEHPNELIAALIAKAFSKDIHTVDQEVRPFQLSGDLAKALNTKPGSLALNIIRQYRDEQGEVIAVSENFYPADRFTLVMQMKRDGV